MSMQTTYAMESEIYVKTSVLTGVISLETSLYGNSSKQWHNFVPPWKTATEFKKDTFTRQAAILFRLSLVLAILGSLKVWET